MAFATSPSAFGIKPATTGSAFGNSSTQSSGLNPNPSPFSAFGAPSSQQPAQQQTSLFGSSNQGQPQGQNPPSIFGQQASGQQPQQSSGGLFSSTQTTQPTQPTQPSQSGFGTWGQNTQNQPSTGFGTRSIFGNPSGQNQQQPSSGFGTGNSIFGNTSNQQQNQPQPSTGFGTGGGILGNTSTQQQNQPSTGFNTGGSIFGNTGTQQQQQQQQQQQPSTGLGTGGSIFGNTGIQQQNQQQPLSGFGTGSGIFGNPGGQQQQTPQGGSLWGAAPNPGQPATGAGTSQQQAPPSFTRTTRFNDLPEQIQKTLEGIDTYIQGRIQISNDLKARSLAEEPTKAAELIRRVHNDLVNTMSTLQADKAIAEELRSKVDQSVQDTIITTRIMDGFRNPQQNGAYLKNHANFPLEFFSRAADEIRQKLQWYKTTIEQIERRLASAQSAVQYNPQAITATLQAQNSTFIALASKTAELDAELQKIKALYRELWRAHTGSARDFFNELDRRPGDGGGMLNGISSLNLNK